MNKDPRLVTALVRHLTKECALYERYLKTLEKQRKALVDFNHEMIVALNEKRARIVQETQDFQEKRLLLQSELPRGKERRLVELIQDHFVGKERAELEKLALRLRELVTEARKLSQEYAMNNQFALNMVNGSISLIWQGTQNVTKRYGVNGVMQESYNPTHSRHEGVLRSA